MASSLALIALLILGIGLLSQRLQGGMLTAPMLCVPFGYFFGHSLLPEGFQGFEFLFEMTLIMVLFDDACRVRVKCSFWDEFSIPLRLLTVGLLSSIGIGSLLGFLIFPSLGWWQALILAGVLTATDAALGKNIMESRLIPKRWREILSVESGLNDGIILPVLLLLGAPTGFSWLSFLQHILIGLALGALTGYLGGQVLRWGSRAHAINRIFEQLSGLALAFLSYAVAELAGGNGFVAVFVAGLIVANTSQHVPERFLEFTEAQAELFSLLAFAAFGAFMLPGALEAATLQIWVYALLILSVVRMAAVAFSLLGEGLRRREVLFLGWLGPRGIASLLFALLLVNKIHVPGQELIFNTVCITVFVSIYLHGLSAVPIAKAFGTARA